MPEEADLFRPWWRRLRPSTERVRLAPWVRRPALTDLLHRHGLLVRVAVLGLVVQTIVLGGAGLWQAGWLIAREEQRAVSRLQEIGKLMADGAVRLEMAAHPDQLSLLVGEPVVESMIVSSNGHVMVASDARRLGMAARDLSGIDPVWFQPTDGPLLIRPTDSDLDIGMVAPLLFHEAARPRLFLYLRAQRKHLLHGIKEITTLFTISSLIVISLSIVTITVALDRLVTRKVEAAAAALRRHRDGNLEVRVVEDGGNGAIATLQRGINVLANEIAQHRNRLETLVAQRTAELTAARSRLAMVLDIVPDAIVAFDRDDALVVINRKASETFPYLTQATGQGGAAAAFVGHLAGSLAVGTGIPPERLDDLRTAPEFEEQMELRDGRAMKITSRRGPEDEVVVSLADVTPYAVAARSLEAALSKERNINSLHQSFVSMVSHQFRTPLAIIDAAAQRIIRSGDRLSRDDLVARLERVRFAVGRMTRLIDTILGTAQFDAGEIAFNPRSVDIKEMIVDWIDRIAEAHEDTSIRLDLDTLPPRMKCDPGLIEQVVHNLLSNAIKYSSAGSAIVVQGKVEDGMVILNVQDHGIGIDDEDLPRIFQRYFRASSARAIAGTGLGLSVARDFVRIHGGDMLIASRRGVGTTVSVRLPIENGARRNAGAVDGDDLADRG